LLSAERRKATRKLADGVCRLLGELGMGGTRLEIAIEPCAASACGIDAIEFRIAGHSAGTARPLARVASGGELSRIGLAIAVLAAQSSPVPTLIFDEADAGVGGAVAEVIGNLMRKLGANCQVLCVTHLPQVAARAHQQLRVSREQQAGGVLSRVQLLARTERVEEIARMLGGVEITATTRKHAREMLAAQSD
jgi:DNA repair protein RecN (Recombination protein N)